MIESADWSLKKDSDFAFDYRKFCIQILAEHHRHGAARRLSSLLRRRPTSLLAEYAAPILAQEHCYEAAPELMRYALLHPGRDQDAAEALESMHIPQAGLAILRHEAFWMETPNENENVSSYTETHLATLLGNDVGPKWGDWVHYYDDEVHKRPTPLSAAQASEIDRVILAVTSYWTTNDRLWTAGRASSIPPPNLDVPGTTALEQEISKYQDAAKAQVGK